MSKNVCVPIKSKPFKDLAKKLNINAESLEIAIKEWLNKGNEWSSDTDNILEEYLKKYFNINSTYYYSGKDIEKLKKAKVLIDSLDSNDVNTYRKAINVYNKAIKIFGKENVSLYKDYEGNYKVSISEPIDSKEEFESNNIQERTTIFTTSKSTDYPSRTKENVDWSDITLALATDFNTAGERLTKKSAKDKYISYQLHSSINKAEDIANYLYNQIQSKGKTKDIKLNIAGNGIYSLNKEQYYYNNLLTEVLQKLLDKGITISSIRSGGQTGIDEAGIIAAQRLGIPNEVHTTSNYMFRGRDGKDISDEEKFKARFIFNPLGQEGHMTYEDVMNLFDSRKTYKGMITSLQPNQIFVFGSNTEGRHGAGAAKTAKDKFGAKYGQAEGPQGQSYAIITKDLTKDDKKHPSRTKEQIIEQIHKLYEYAKANPNKEFLVAYSSTGRNLNYYTNQEMAEMFANEEIPSNIVFEEGFNELVSNSNKTITTPSRQETKEQNQIEETNKLQESKNLVQRIIEDSENNIRRHPDFEENHTYQIKRNGDWVNVDMSVTEYIHGKLDIGPYKVPSDAIGNTLDRFVRTYFDKTLSEEEKNTILRNIPNLSKKDRDNLIKDLEILKQSFNNLFEGEYEIITKEFPIAGNINYIDKNGNSVSKSIAGTMDMMAYDSKGNFYILDMKTKRIDNEINWRKNTFEGYRKQLNIYKSILESNYPELAGKIKSLHLIKFNVNYPRPSEVEYSINESKDKDYLLADGVRVTSKTGYSAPRLAVNEGNEGLIPVDKLKLKEKLNTLTQEEKAVLDNEITNAEVPSAASQSEDNTESKQTDNLYNTAMLPASERQFLANTAIAYASYIISNLQSSPKANKYFFGDEFLGYDFTTMSRNEIIDKVGIMNILNYVKESFFDISKRTDIQDFNTLMKLNLAYENWGALIRSAYSKLISMEKVTIIESNPYNVKEEDLYLEAEDSIEGGTLEEKEREYWQLGQRQISARASLSGDIKREFEKLVVVDKKGNPILDKYGYGFKTFVDSGVAINQIFSWTDKCTSMSEMEEVLTSMSKANPWLNNILDKIKKEPFRSMFFQNFRKSATKYSIVSVSRNSKGERVYDVTIVNTVGALKGILDNVTESYNSGVLRDIIIPLKDNLNGEGKVNEKKVKELRKEIQRILNKITKASKGKEIISTVNSEVPNITKLLNSFGIIVDDKTLLDAFAKDSDINNYTYRNSFKVLSQLDYIVDTLLNEEVLNKVNYNPIEKGEDFNLYNNYKKLIEVFASYIQDSIESSTYENGKMYYTYTNPSYMDKLMLNLKDAIENNDKFEHFIQEEYGKYRFFKDEDDWKCPWLRMIVENPSIRKEFNHKVQLSYNKTDYKELSELGYTLSLMKEFFYDNKNKDKNKWAWYRIPILANKPSSEFVRFRRYGGSKRYYKREIINGLKDVFDQELMRIKTVLERSVNPNVNKIGVKEKITFDIKDSMLTPNLEKKIKTKKLTLKDLVTKDGLVFKGSGAEFKFLEALNQELINKTELGQLIVDKINGKDIDESNFNDLFSESINNYMDLIVEKQLNDWKSIGLFDTEEVTTKNVRTKKEETKTVFKYVSDLGKSESDIIDNLENYIWNDMFATINIIELTATDLAYYKNVEDFQKRYSQIHAPALRLNPEAETPKNSKFSINGRYSADGKARTFYLKDFIHKSDIIANIDKAFKDKINSMKGIPSKKVEMEHLKMMKDLILSAFEEINVADAQGYSSPTSYRKKLGMAGKWTPEMEEAYTRIVNGNYTVNDLGIIWQPEKPFVYTQIAKPSGAKTMSELKVPVQNKNSEYLLFLADAIMRGNNQSNKLIALFDFMEESAYDGRIMREGKVIKEGTYNGVGIDTVQFESAVNSGSMGSIDINNAEDYDSIKEILNNAVYFNKDKSEDSENNYDRYNAQNVHTYSFEDYGIQQEVPAHLVDHEQLMGSQIRILSISDITPGTKFKIGKDENEVSDKELIKEYQELIAANIKESFETLKKDFKLNGSRREQNIALSNLLKESILKDQRYGADLLRACELDRNGEFNIPLCDPVQSIRIQQLLNSIIKSRINKQKIKGGPVVQATSFGLSEDLNIIWKDKEGNPLKKRNEFNSDAEYKEYVDTNQAGILYFECYMPIPSRDLELALTKKDGTLMSIEEAVEAKIIPEEMRKAIGYRI